MSENTYDSSDETASGRAGMRGVLHRRLNGNMQQLLKEIVIGLSIYLELWGFQKNKLINCL